jgi:hypothetical protein
MGDLEMVEDNSNVGSQGSSASSAQDSNNDVAAAVTRGLFGKSKDRDTAESLAPESKPDYTPDKSDDEKPKHRSIRSALKANMKADVGDLTTSKPDFERNLGKVETSQSSANEDAKTPANANAAPATTSAEPIAPPRGMRADEIEAFKKASPELQKFISRRSYETETDYVQQTQAVAEVAREFDSLREVIEPVKEEYARRGISVPDLARRSIAWDRAMSTNPIDTAREWLSAHGILPEELLGDSNNNSQGSESGQSQMQSMTPEEIREIIRQDRLAEKQEIEQQYRQQEALQVGTQFVAQKSLFKDPGTAAQVEAAMVPIVKALRVSDPYAPSQEILETAYQTVLARNPNFAELANRYEGKALAESTRAKAMQAQAASRSISGGPGSGTPARNLNFRDNLRLRMTGGY